MQHEWPVWTAPPPTAPETDGYGGIACYVAPSLIEHHIGHAFPRGLTTRFVGTPVEVHRQVASALWASLVERAIPYTAPPWHPRAGQRIRDPEWLWRSTGSGTCIDLAVLMAGACLRQEMATYLLLLRGPSAAHAAVVLRLGAGPIPRSFPAGVMPTSEPGVGKLADISAFLGAHDVLLMDPTTATEGSSDTSLAGSSQQLAKLLSDPAFTDVHLVSVGDRHVLGDEPLPQPTRRGALRTTLGRPALVAPMRFAAHTRARARLDRITEGSVVLHGGEGTGKSTLARQIAAQFDHGFGWVLSAATPATLRTSLARAELAERGEELTRPDAEIERELARSALDRLTHTVGGWVVVIDNANGGAKQLGTLPIPRAGQLLLVTTTDSAQEWPGYEPVGLDPVAGDTDDVPDEIAPLTAGNPLLSSAWAALHAVAPEAVSSMPSTPVADIDDGADRYWSAVQSAHPDAAPLARQLALLPPDAITRSVAEVLGSGLNNLLEVGVVTPLTDGTLSMHRVLGRAIRSTDDDPMASATRVLDWAAARSLLARRGDSQITQQLSVALVSSTDGVALARLGALQELHDGVKASLATYDRARDLLEPMHPAAGNPAAGALADCLHAAARVVNQAREGTVNQAELTEARDRALRAAQLRGPDEEAEREKHIAMAALIRQRAARGLKLGSPELVAELHAVRAELEGSYQTRRKLLGDDDPLVDRAFYNLAGVHIRLAQAEPEHAAEHLQQARAVYTGTLAFRVVHYADLSPLTAASELGIGMWGYYSVLLKSAENPQAVILDALDHSLRSLRIREGLGARNDVVKSASMLAKLALLQVGQAGGEPVKAADSASVELGSWKPAP